LTIGTEYHIAARVSNLGSGTAFTLCVDFLSFVEIADRTNVYTLVSAKQEFALQPGKSKVVVSDPWTPGFGLGKKPGNVIVRAFDPRADHYLITGHMLYVNRDRHLAHKSFT